MRGGSIRKKIHETRVGVSCAVRIYRIAEWDEYLVRTIVAGRFVGGKDSGYHTPDKDDARNTAAAEVRKLKKLRGAACGRP